MPKAPSTKRYALAAFELAREGGRIEQWAEDLARANEALQSEGLIEALESPKIGASQKVSIIRQSITGLDPLVTNLLCLLASHNRIGQLPGILEDYQALTDANYGRVRAMVTTAVPLEPEQEQRIKRQLEAMVGLEVVITSHMDPEVMGGVMARVGDRIIDGTLRGRLLGLKRHLAQVRG
ncbi:MAG: F0F1 ATP synthase subunit delta [Chloroflexi bacterium]|nr:F0F1 ATP synthase subunit delta [Chloroflexota bacterium]